MKWPFSLLQFFCFLISFACYGQSKYQSTNHFSLQIPAKWDTLPRTQVEAFSLNVGVKSMKIFTENPLIRMPSLRLLFHIIRQWSAITSPVTELIFNDGTFTKVTDRAAEKFSDYILSFHNTFYR